MSKPMASSATKTAHAPFTKENLLGMFDALRDAGRFRIFMELKEEREEFCVTDIARMLGVSVPAASRQLKILEQAGLIERKREGQIVCYEVRKNDATVKQLLAFCNRAH